MKRGRGGGVVLSFGLGFSFGFGFVFGFGVAFCCFDLFVFCCFCCLTFCFVLVFFVLLCFVLLFCFVAKGKWPWGQIGSGCFHGVFLRWGKVGLSVFGLTLVAFKCF